MSIEDHISSVPHRAGSPADYATATFVRDRLARDGFATRVEQLNAALFAFQKAAAVTDAQMVKAEAAGDAATMEKLSVQEQQAPAAFFVPGGLSSNKYLHTMDRVFVSYPEVLFAGDNPRAQQAAIDRMTAAVTNATSALAQKT